MTQKFKKQTLTQLIARKLLTLAGWRIEVAETPPSRCILIAVYHTSNWDFIVAILFMLAEALPIQFLGKDSLFKWPLGILMRYFNILPVNRQGGTNVVDDIAAKFAEQEHLIIGLAPEGTRSKRSYWKTGFYFIAQKANVPIVPGFINYEKKYCGLGKSFIPSGDINKDFDKLREFYAPHKGKFPDKQSDIAVKI